MVNKCYHRDNEGKGTANGKMVWLYFENQFNYKAAHDLAVQIAVATLPVTFKLGDADHPEYVSFDSLEALTAFFAGAMQFIRLPLSDGWKAKDFINLEIYNVSCPLCP